MKEVFEVSLEQITKFNEKNISLNEFKYDLKNTFKNYYYHYY